jgi:pimeloyl-ACP methyl ester carboxylesterase
LRDWHALLIHGAGGGAWEWNRWQGVLEAHALSVEAITLAPVASGLAATRLHDYLDQVRAALQAMPHPRVAIGASLGGLLAALCARDADAVVLVNPLPPAPWHAQLPQREWEATVPWQHNARLASSREAMVDADEASVLFAFRQWRDESGAVLRETQSGITIGKPFCPALFIASSHDPEVPPAIIRDWAQAWQADRLETLAGSHVGPLLGCHAADIASQTVAWLNRLDLPR